MPSLFSVFRVDSLKEKFSAFGEVGDIYIPRMTGSMEPRGYAFVRYMSHENAEDAMKEMDGKEFEGLVLHVHEAKAKRPDDPKSYYSKGGPGFKGG
jgi:arginine/serine-rich splicing factor 2